jgi:superfamily II DNA or RNA helicase
MQIKLRDYQELAIAKLDDEFRKGNRRVILWCQTGSGKTTLAAWLIARSIRYDYPVIFIVRGRELVKNASDTLSKYNIDHSVNMSGHYKYNQKKLVQVCSVDTLKSRSNYPFRDKEPLMFLDECHKNYDDIFEEYPNAFIIGMSGTPFTDMSKYYSYVQPIEGYELRDQGFLVSEKMYCPHVIDVTAVKKTAGDFNKKQLESVVTQVGIVGNIVEDWIKYGDKRPTVCFAVSVEHSKQLSQAFQDKGFSSVHCDANSDDKERKAAKDGLENGKIKVVCNVDVFSVGWDCPIVSCVILARPTWSLTWYLQAIGRGLRSNPNKSDCIILDNAGNVFRHGLPYRIREISLEKPNKRKSPKMDNKVCTCEECFYIFDPEVTLQCPECGWMKPKVVRTVKEIDGSLTQYQESETEYKERLFTMMRTDYYKMEWVRKNKKLHSNWTFITLKKKYPAVFNMMNKITVVPIQFLEDPQGQLYY